MENAPGPDGHADPKEPPVDRDEAEDRGVPDSATRGPEGPELHDQVGHPGPDGSPAGDPAVPGGGGGGRAPRRGGRGGPPPPPPCRSPTSRSRATWPARPSLRAPSAPPAP